MSAIGFVIHHHRAGTVTLAEETTAWLKERGHEAHEITGEGEALPPLDVVVSLGGDGTMLRTVDLVARAKVPVIGVNFGHLGYLTTVEPAHLRSALERFLAGDYMVEERMTLEIVASAGERTLLQASALNDVVLQRPAGQHTVEAQMCVNGSHFVTFVADSLIVATPTGSTAYNLSARGPIVSPRARCQIVTPVAAHMLFDRSLVLAPEDEVLLAPGDEHPADVVVDGWTKLQLQPGQVLRCRQGPHDARLVTFGDRDFHHILKAKFNLSDR